MQDWTLQPIVHPGLLAIVAVCLLLLLLFGPSYLKIDRKKRMTLTLLRLGVITLAILAMLRPGCVQKIERSQASVVAVLADVSRSMELPHREDKSTRYGAMKEMLDGSLDLIDNLREQQISFRFYGFDNEVVSLDSEGQWELPEKPTGGETDIGSALFETAIASRQERLIGMFMLSDGVANVLDPKIELSQVGNSLNEMAVPLYAVPFGLPGDAGQVADVAVVSLPEQHRIAVKNQLTVQATVSARGFSNRPVKVQLYVSDAEGKEQLVDTVQFVPDKPFVEEKVKLRHIPTEAGQFRMRVRAEAQGNELAVRNNELPSFLNVYAGGLRVLYLDGSSGWEQSFLRRAIASASQSIELIPITIYSDEESRSKWPLTGQITLWLKDPTIDVFIIGDVDSSALYNRNSDENNLQLIADAVDRGKGLIMLGGSHSFGPGGYHSTPLDDVLPIKMNLDERQQFPPAKLRSDLHINQPVKLLPQKDHFITRLGSDDLRGNWKRLPPLAGANRFIGVKNNAEVLLKSENDNPIMVAGRLGGRVLAFAGDSTWRWVMQGHEDEFKQFWRQILLWLALQDGREKNSVWIDLPQRRFQPESYVTFQCQASDSLGSLIPDAEFNADLFLPDGSKESILIDPGTKRGAIEKANLAEPGVYRIQLTGKHKGQELGGSLAEFVVFDRDREKSSPAADPEQMSRLAAKTQKHGGRVVLPEDFREFLEALRDNPPEKIEVPLKWQLGQTWEDGTAYLVLFATLLGIEWFLRKNWGLV